MDSVKITFSPVEGLPPTDITVEGDMLTIDGRLHDFTDLAEGDVLTMESVNDPMVVSDVMRVNGEIVVTVILPHGPDAEPTTRYPVAMDVVTAGEVSLPPYEPLEENT